MTPATPSSAPPGVLARLVEGLRGRRVAVLTGAGCSTESGIPDYRGPDGTLRVRAPLRYGEFMGDGEARRRYWARSAVGWPRFTAARPNPAHVALARLEAAGAVAGVVTQNVDGLHRAAGSRRVVDLHGVLSRVRCTGCGRAVSRAAVQGRLLAANPGFEARAVRMSADGDAELEPDAHRDFVVPPCEACGGVLKPDVVLFGENVPRERVEDAWRIYEEGDALWVAGSSLEVFSGRRFVMRAAREGKPVFIANLGPTRGDEVAELKVEAPLGSLLSEVASALLGGG